MRQAVQQGLSLIELLIALAISSLLILGVSQIYIDNKSNYLFQQGQSGNIENARYTLLVFEEELYRTGYRARPDDEFENVFRAGTVGHCTFAAGEVITYDAASERICLRYQPSVPDLFACDGSTLSAANAPYRDIAPVSVELQIMEGQLRCKNAASSDSVVIIDNLVDFKFEFGVSEALREPERYTQTPTEKEKIRAVRYAALIRSRFDTIADDTDSAAYASWHAKWYEAEGAQAPDRALYLTAESTLNLRNLTK